MYVCETAANAASTIKSANFVLLFALNKSNVKSSQVDGKTFEKHYLHTDPSDGRSGSKQGRGRFGHDTAAPKSANAAPSSFCIHTCRHTDRLAYIHALPFIIGRRDTER